MCSYIEIQGTSECRIRDGAGTLQQTWVTLPGITWNHRHVLSNALYKEILAFLESIFPSRPVFLFIMLVKGKPLVGVAQSPHDLETFSKITSSHPGRNGLKGIGWTLKQTTALRVTTAEAHDGVYSSKHHYQRRLGVDRCQRGYPGDQLRTYKRQDNGAPGRSFELS